MKFMHICYLIILSPILSCNGKASSPAFDYCYALSPNFEKPNSYNFQILIRSDKYENTVRWVVEFGIESKNDVDEIFKFLTDCATSYKSEDLLHKDLRSLGQIIQLMLKIVTPNPKLDIKIDGTNKQFPLVGGQFFLTKEQFAPPLLKISIPYKIAICQDSSNLGQFCYDARSLGFY